MPSLIKIHSLRINSNLSESAVKTLKSSKFMVQLQYNRWSDIADCKTVLKRFPVRDPEKRNPEKTNGKFFRYK